MKHLYEENFIDKCFIDIEEILKKFTSANIPPIEFWNLMVKAQLVKKGFEKWEECDIYESRLSSKFPKIIWHGTYNSLKNFLEDLSEDGIIERLKKEIDVLNHFYVAEKDEQSKLSYWGSIVKIKCFHTSKLLSLLNHLFMNSQISLKPNMYSSVDFHFCDREGKPLNKNNFRKLKSKFKDSAEEHELLSNVERWIKASNSM